MKELVETMVKSMVDAPDELTVTRKGEDNFVVFEVDCPQEDRGKLIGKRGKNIEALRTILKAAATRENCITYLRVKEED